jgi:signal transduction histidine kinase
MNRYRFLWSVHPLLAVVEAWGVALLALLALRGFLTAQPVVLSAGLLFMCGVAGLWAVLAARVPAGSARRQVGIELLTAGLLAAGMLAVQQPAGWLGLMPAWRQLGFAPGIISVVLLCTGVGYLGCRVVVRAWLVWDGMRRRRMLWSITHAHLMLVVLAAAAGSLALFYLTPFSHNVALAQAESHGLLATAAARFLLDIFPALSIIIILTVVAIVIILPPSALFSYFVARQTTRRLEALTRATAALRGGDYAARTPVQGEDEVAQLQADFNAMAERLQRTLADLSAERDNVAQLLRARRELVAAVSHELRTPVATVRATLDSLLEHGEEAPARHDLEVMEGEVLRLQGMIDDLFTLSRAEVDALSLECGPVDVAAALHQMVEAMAPLAWQGGRVEVVAMAPADVPAGLPAACADVERLKQVMANLLRNAVRFTPPGGIVVAAAMADEGGVRIEVRDTGAGIAPADLPHIWDRFYRSADSRTHDRGGAGLGLALVKELTEAMGGRVAVESRPGEGSCFSVWLPGAEPHPQPLP